MVSQSHAGPTSSEWSRSVGTWCHVRSDRWVPHNNDLAIFPALSRLSHSPHPTTSFYLVEFSYKSASPLHFDVSIVQQRLLNNDPQPSLFGWRLTVVRKLLLGSGHHKYHTSVTVRLSDMLSGNNGETSSESCLGNVISSTCTLVYGFMVWEG
jgi:hypothetical protein